MQQFCYADSMTEKVTLTKRGVITIPAKLREAFGLKADDELILESVEEGILIRPSMSVPLEIYSEARVAEFAEDEDALGQLLPPGR